MEVNQHNAQFDDLPRRFRWRRLAVVIALVLVAAAMAVLLWLMFSAAGKPDVFSKDINPEQAKRNTLRLAWVCATVLAVTLVLLVWAVARLLAPKPAHRPGEHPRTDYIDAWSLAGKRLKLDKDIPADDVEDEEDGDKTKPKK